MNSAVRTITKIYIKNVPYSRGLAGLCLRETIKHFQELVHEGLTLEAEKEMLEVTFIEIVRTRRVSPELHGRDVCFFSHTVIGLS